MKKLIASAGVVVGVAALIASVQGPAQAASVVPASQISTSTESAEAPQWVGSAALKAAGLATRAAKVVGIQGDSARPHSPVHSAAADVFDK